MQSEQWISHDGTRLYWQHYAWYDMKLNTRDGRLLVRIPNQVKWEHTGGPDDIMQYAPGPLHVLAMKVIGKTATKDETRRFCELLNSEYLAHELDE
jgi:hypothetical protein